MKKTLLLSLLCCGALFCTAGYAKSNEQSLDQIVAVVNDDVITKSEFNQSISTAKVQIAQEHLPMPPDSILQKQVLDQLINKKLQLQMAQQAGVEISDDELDKTIGRIAAQNQISVQALYAKLNQDGMRTDDYRSELRDQLTLQKLQQQEVAGKITVTPQEVTAFMKSAMWKTNAAKEYHLEDILIPVSDTPTPEEIAAARTQAEAVLDKLHQGQNFSQVAQANSGSKNALQGGDLGWRGLPEIPSAFADHVTHMKAHDIAGPIQTPNGFHILRLAAVRASAADQAAPSRKQIENQLLQQKFEEAVQNWVSRLRSQAFIEMNLPKNDYA